MLNFRVMTLDQLLALVNDDFYKNVTSKAELEAYSKNVYHKACLADGDFNNPSQFYIRSFQERAFGLFDHIHNIKTDFCPLQANGGCGKITLFYVLIQIPFARI